jgi:UV excision repair protein RAD23
VTGEDYEAAVKQLMEMGFTRDRVIEALRSSFNNPDRAAEYLYTSAGDSDDIPPLNEQFAPLPLQASSIVRGDFNPSGPSPPAPPVRINPSGSYPATVRPNPPPQPPTTSSSNTIDPLTMLSQMPQFQSIREQVQANPQLLQAFLQQLGQSNPMLLQLINSDPQRFVDLLNAPITPAGTANEGDDDNEGQPPAGSVSIQVTPEDKEVIDRVRRKSHVIYLWYFVNS